VSPAAGAEALEVDLAIPPGELLRLYRGEVRAVVARARDGRVVRFPVGVLRPFVGRDGVQGRFLLRCDATQRLLGIERLG
jgi:Protein of unknown function (DUF2835)